MKLLKYSSQRTSHPSIHPVEISKASKMKILKIVPQRMACVWKKENYTEHLSLYQKWEAFRQQRTTLQVHRERWLSTCIYTFPNLSRCFQTHRGSLLPHLFLEEDLAVYCSKMRNEPWKRKTWFSRNWILIWTVMKGSPDNCKWPGVTNPVWNRKRENWERLERARKDKCIKG